MWNRRKQITAKHFGDLTVPIGYVIISTHSLIVPKLFKASPKGCQGVVDAAGLCQFFSGVSGTIRSLTSGHVDQRQLAYVFWCIGVN